jgi:hypothetical protein
MLNHNLNNLIALGQDMARRTSEIYAQIAEELAEIGVGQTSHSQHKDVISYAPPADKFPVDGPLRYQILYVIAQAGDAGLTTGEIVKKLKDKGYKFGIEVALSKLPQTLRSMESKHMDIRVERMPNGRKRYHAIAEKGKR